MAIITLWKQGKSKSEISRITKHDRKTIRKIIKRYAEEGSIPPLPILRSSKLDSYKNEILEYLEQDLSGVRIHEKLLESGVAVKYRTLSEYISKLKTPIMD